MNRKNLVYVFLVLLVALILVMVFTGKWEALTGGRPDFAIADTGSVNRIKILGADTVNLERSAGGWKVDERYKADPVAVNNILYAFNHLDISGMMNANTVNGMQEIGLQIVVGRRERQVRFIPSPTKPVMFKKGSQKVYQVEVTGSPKADLGVIINDNPGYWRDKTLVDLSPDEIKSIEVVPAEKWGKGFIIERRGDSLIMETLSGEVIPGSLVDQERLLMYTSYFNGVFYDSTFNDSTETVRLLNSKPDYSVSVTDMTGKQYRLDMYPLKNANGTDDIFHGLVRFNDEKHLLIVRYVVLDLLRQNLSHFTVK